MSRRVHAPTHPSSDRTVAEFVGGAWVLLRQPAHPDRPNFLIMCPYGDWSGYRTLDECLAQPMATNRPDYFFWVEER